MTPKEIENLWDQFVPRIGGKPVREMVGAGVTFPNADYVFADDNIVAELKVLSADLQRTSAGQAAFAEMMDRWRATGLINLVVYGTRLIRSSELPEECQRELAAYFGKRLLKDISDANKQIKATKAALGMPDAYGLLLLVNDGSYHLAPDALRFNLSRGLRPRHDSAGQPLSVQNKAIDNVVALTIGMPAQAPGVPVPVQLWLPAFRDSRQIAQAFLDKLAAGWFNFMADTSGAPVPVFNVADHSAVFAMKFTEEGRESAPWSKPK